MKILEKYKNMKIYFHCWWYDKEEVDIVQKIFTNVRIWYDGNITYKQAGNIRNSILNTNINNILIETDAPFLTPQIIRKEKNQPSNIIYIYDYISTLLKIDLSTLQKKINTNFNNFYDL
jgi:TatD DNase family protein